MEVQVGAGDIDRSMSQLLELRDIKITSLNNFIQNRSDSEMQLLREMDKLRDQITHHQTIAQKKIDHADWMEENMRKMAE